MKAQILLGLRFLFGKNREKKSIASTVSLISFVGVVLGVMVPIVVLSVMMGFQEEIRSKILGVKGHIVLTSSSFNPYIKNYQEIVEKIKSFQGVVSVNPYIELQGMVQFLNGFEPVIIRGVLPNYFTEDKEMNKIFEITMGEKNLDKRYQITIGNELAKKRLVNNGDRVKLLVTEQDNFTLNSRPQTIEARVNGIFKTGFQQFDNGMVYVSLSTFQKLFRKKNIIKRIDIKVENIWNINPIINDLVKEYGDNYRIYTWQDINYNFFKALALERILMYFIVSLILIVAIFNVTSSQLIFIIEKKKEIGILKTIGMKPFHIAQIFLFQGCIISTLGALVGGLLGYLISLDVMAIIRVFEFFINIFFYLFYFIKSIFVGSVYYQSFEIFPKGVYYLDYIPSDISLSRTLFFISMAIFLSALVGFLPSIKAARLKPIDVMRYE
jgi:lipoprotein-releasing system permease protein